MNSTLPRTPFSRIYYISAANTAGDRLIVGTLSDNYYRSGYFALPLPSAPNQHFCEMQEMYPGHYFNAYVPTAAEKAGNFSASFGVLLRDPSNNLPFPNGIIPVNRYPTVVAWRIAPTEPGGCVYFLGNDGQAFPPAGGTASVTVTAGEGCPWTVVSNDSWVNISNGNSGTGNGTIMYQVPANSAGGRAATLTISGPSASFNYRIEQQAVSVPGLAFTGSMPHLVAQGIWNTTFTLVNKGTSTATSRLNFFNDYVGPLNLPLSFPQAPGTAVSATSLDRDIAANASVVISTAGSGSSPYQVGSAQLSATGSVDGFAIFHLIPGSQEAVVPLETRNASSYVLAFDNTGGVVLGVALQNVANTAATIPVVIRDDTGAIISPPGTALSLQANGHSSFVLSQRYSFTANKRGTVEFQTPSGGRISVLGIRTTPVNNTLTLTTVPALADVGTTGGSIAHIATGAGWQTTFVLVNTGAAPAPATLKFFADETGAPLAIPLSFPQSGGPPSTVAEAVTQTLTPGAQLVIQSLAPASDPEPTIGSAQLTTNGNVGGFVIFRYNTNSQEAVVPLENRAANGYLIAFDNTNGTATGIAVNSVSPQTVNVPVVVRDDAGNQIATDTLTLAANGHTSFTLGVDKFPVAAGKRGTIEFVTPSEGQIGALGIRIPPALTFTTLPALAK